MRLVVTQEPALRITGQLQNVSGVQHVKAETIEPLREALARDQADPADQEPGVPHQRGMQADRGLGERFTHS